MVALDYCRLENKGDDLRLHGVQLSLQGVRQAAEAIKYNHPYRKYIDTVLSKCPAEFAARLRRNDDYVDYNESEAGLPTEKALIKMHLNVMSVSLLARWVCHCYQLLHLWNDW